MWTDKFNLNTLRVNVKFLNSQSCGLMGQFHGFAHVQQALALSVVNFAVLTEPDDDH